MVELVIRMQALSATKATLLEAGRTLLEPVRADRYCVDSRLLEDTEDPFCLWLVQRWNDEAAMKRHIQRSRFRALLLTIELQYVACQVMIGRLDDSRTFDGVSDLFNWSGVN